MLSLGFLLRSKVQPGNSGVLQVALAVRGQSVERFQEALQAHLVPQIRMASRVFFD